MQVAGLCISSLLINSNFLCLLFVYVCCCCCHYYCCTLPPVRHCWLLLPRLCYQSAITIEKLWVCCRHPITFQISIKIFYCMHTPCISHTASSLTCPPGIWYVFSLFYWQQHVQPSEMHCTNNKHVYSIRRATYRCTFNLPTD